MSIAPNPATAIEVFYSYSHQDEDLRNRLASDLSILRRNGVITGWHDRRIGAGIEVTVQVCVLVIPAEAGIHGATQPGTYVDTGLRRCDDSGMRR